jgi:hypothetical protein
LKYCSNWLIERYENSSKNSMRCDFASIHWIWFNWWGEDCFAVAWSMSIKNVSTNLFYWTMSAMYWSVWLLLLWWNIIPKKNLKISICLLNFEIKIVVNFKLQLIKFMSNKNYLNIFCIFFILDLKIRLIFIYFMLYWEKFEKDINSLII